MGSRRDDLEELRGLLLAGGHGTRLRPLTYTGNKHMLPIGNKPMLLYGLEHLKRAGIHDVGIILGPISEGVRELIGDGSKYGLKITYIEQPEPKGLAHAVLISENYMQGESFVMYLGDNLLRQGVSDFVATFMKKRLDCLVGVCPVRDPTRYGIAEMKGDKIVKLIEKPKQPKSNLALIGVYVFGPAIFSAAEKIKPSWRNELEITDAIQMLLNEGKKVEAQRVSSWWKDTGRPEDLLEANQLVLSALDETSIRGEISPESTITGNLDLGEGSKFLGGVSIRGPVIIGKNCRIGPDVYVGPYTAIGDDCSLDHVEIENSIIMNGASVQSGKRIVDSLIGSFSTIKNGDISLPRGYKLIIGERSFAQI
jgi:glucose-1-phosphate thymidylyltransferase